MIDFPKFSRYLRAFAAPNTVESYTRAARTFSSFVGDPPTLTPTCRQEFVQFLSERGNSPSTVRIYNAGVGHLLEWLKASGAALPEFGKVRMPKLKHAEAGVLSKDELASFLALIRTEREPWATAFFLLSVTGMRVEECCTIKATQIEIKDGGEYWLRDVGHKGNPRSIYIVPDAVAWLFCYIDERHEKLGGARAYKARGEACSWLFPADEMGAICPSGDDPQRGHGCDGGHIKERAIQTRLHRLRAKLDRPDITPHTFRHTAATRWHDDGVPIALIQKMLGHAEITTTVRYIHSSHAALKSAMDKTDGGWMR